MAGTDYTNSSGTLTFAPGQTSRTFTVPIINDTADESNEELGLRLGNPVGATLGAQVTTALRIIDDDPVSAWKPDDSASSGWIEVLFDRPYRLAGAE